MRILPVLGLFLSPLLCSGCFSLSVGTKSEPSQLEMSGLADGYAKVDALPEYNGTIFKVGLFSESNREGEWASIDLWPLGGVGVGFVGARVRILFLEVAGGVLGFPEEHPKAKKKKAEPKKEEQKAESAPPEKKSE